MDRKESGFLLCQRTGDERGVVFPLAIVLLFVVTGACLLYANVYFVQIKTYSSLESITIRATINILEQIEK